MTVFVVKEDGQYKLLDTLDKPNAIALEMVGRIDTGDLKGAKALLDWLREDQHLEGGDDPLGGPVFPRFWTKGEAADARKMKLAAAAIMVSTKPTVAQGVAILEAGLKDAAGDRERTNIEIALAQGYSLQDNFAGLLDDSSALLKEEPESKQAFLYNIEALMGLSRFDDALAQADARLKLLDNDSDAYSAKMEIEANRGDFAAAHAWGEKLLALGQENAETLNGLAWDALFTGKVTDDDIAMAVKATQLQKDAPDNLITAVPVYGVAAGNSLVFLGEVLTDGPETLFHFNAPAGVHKVVIDPNQTILTSPK